MGFIYFLLFWRWLILIFDRGLKKNKSAQTIARVVFWQKTGLARLCIRWQWFLCDKCVVVARTCRLCLLQFHLCHGVPENDLQSCDTHSKCWCSPSLLLDPRNLVVSRLPPNLHACQGHLVCLRHQTRTRHRTCYRQYSGLCTSCWNSHRHCPSKSTKLSGLLVWG